MRKFINLLIIGCYLFLSWTYAKELPNLGNHSYTVLSQQEEAKLGLAFMAAIQHQVPLVNDPLIDNYIQGLGDKLASHTGNNKSRFHFFIVKDSSINAFSGPGGYIGVNAGLILTTQNESELAGVLAHEIAHVTQLHIARAIERQKALTLPTIATMLAGILVGTQSSSAGAGVIGAAQGGSAQHMLNFIRGNEAEADHIGIQTLESAGYDPMAMATFLERMQQAELDYGSNIPVFFRTHPLNANRIADAKNRAQQLPKQKPKQHAEYYLMQARLRVLLSKTGKTAAVYFQNQLKRHTYQNRDAALYGYALAVTKAKQPKAGTKIMQDLEKRNPHQVMYQIGLAEIDIFKHDYKKALTKSHQTLELYPDFYPIVIQYASTLISAKQPQKAAKFINKELRNYNNDIKLYALLAKAEGKSGNLAQAYIARAKVYELVHNPKMAMIQLEQAQKQPKLDKNTKTIITARINALRQQLAASGA